MLDKKTMRCVKYKKTYILDGVFVVFTDVKPDFYAVQRRSLMTDSFRISMEAKRKRRAVSYLRRMREWIKIKGIRSDN